MAWKVVEHDGWVETFPDDEDTYHDHSFTYYRRRGELRITCRCACQPRIEKVNEIFLINHNSFDGREGVEWANEILNKKS